MIKIFQIFQTACLITTFVFVMMLLIEYLNAVAGSLWQKILLGRRWKQYLVATLLGASPGCLGTFVVFTRYGKPRGNDCGGYCNFW